MGKCYWCRLFLFGFAVPFSIIAVVLSANGICRANALNVRRMAEVGPTVRVTRCDKENRRGWSPNYFVTAEPLAGGKRVTVLVDSGYSQIPEAGETWNVDTTGWWVVFTAKLEE